MSASPRMLAGFVQSSLEAIDDIDPALGRKVRDRLKPETLDAIESASAIALVSVDLDVELTECFFEVAGPERARRALRENLRQSFDKPLLKPLLDGAFALFGRSLIKIIGWAPKVWGLIYRDAGRMVVAASEDGRVRLELTNIPLVIASSPNYLRGSAETFAGIFDVVGVAGEVQLIGPDLATRSAAFVLTWPRSARA
jgi:hypothetical protein